ncbi:hypothetical protein [Amycolatopsis sp. lyj-90]|uniref:hypothetical protein n=1 Tax=Amycolatopsis sp. lyj-90 TaxID=2789285 RepID=UPI00397D00ED
MGGSAAAASERQCDQAVTVSGNGLQRMESRICAEYFPGRASDGRIGTVVATPDISDFWHRRDGRWYGNRSPARITASIILMKDGVTVGDGRTVRFSTSGSAAAGTAVSFPVEFAGDYEVEAEFSLEGGYWAARDGSRIDAAPRSVELIVAAP